MFKPVKEEEEVNSKHGMRTRRSRAPVSLRLTPPLMETHQSSLGIAVNIYKEMVMQTSNFDNTLYRLIES